MIPTQSLMPNLFMGCRVVVGISISFLHILRILLVEVLVTRSGLPILGKWIYNSKAKSDDQSVPHVGEVDLERSCWYRDILFFNFYVFYMLQFILVSPSRRKNFGKWTSNSIIRSRRRFARMTIIPYSIYILYFPQWQGRGWEHNDDGAPLFCGISYF